MPMTELVLPVILVRALFPQALATDPPALQPLEAGQTLLHVLVTLR